MQMQIDRLNRLTESVLHRICHLNTVFTLSVYSDSPQRNDAVLTLYIVLSFDSRMYPSFNAHCRLLHHSIAPKIEPFHVFRGEYRGTYITSHAKKHLS